MRILLVRHGESLANTNLVDPHTQGDFHVRLSEKGASQAQTLVERIDQEFIKTSLIYSSPYERARETLQILLDGHELAPTVYEDPLLREHDRGYHDEESQLAMRRAHGWFYYRHQGGESPADVYLRASVFLESMFREIGRSKKENVLILTHGMFIRCFVMRFLHLNREDFLRMEDPRNTDIVSIVPHEGSRNPAFRSSRWCVEGLRLRGIDEF